MPAKRTAPPPPRPALTRSRVEAEKRIDERIELGKELAQRRPQQWTEMDSFWTEMRKWQDYTFELLASLFTTDAIAKEFRAASFAGVIARNQAEAHRNAIETFVARQIPQLESIRERLELFDEPTPLAPALEVKRPELKLDPSKVFIVHGHDTAALHNVARFVERLGFEAVVLSEQPSQGNTVMEKLAKNSNVGFAVVLLTGDDIGALGSEPEKSQARARQNVVLELGYFLGKLGRDKVCPLYEAGVELPSDFHGVVYVPLDPGEAWKLKLAKEMKAAGLTVNMNKAV